ncbi:MAG: PD-(D/E)XK nuclease domain-containing protein, partial [Succinivibrio sp.]
MKIYNSNGINIIEDGTADDIKELLDIICNSIPYDNYPITSESALQCCVLMYLKGVGVNAHAELHSAKGRADLTVETDKRRIIFEFKYAENETDAKTKLNEAVEQIKTRDYGNILPQKELIRIAA